MIERLKYVLRALLYTLLRGGDTSYTGERAIIKKYLRKLPGNDKVCVDIAASDGMTQSNTLFLYQAGWSGLAVEYDPVKFSFLASHYKNFPSVNLVRTKVVPKNVVQLLQACQLPFDFSFLNLDIDSYDYYVLDQLLSVYRPQLICAEINENIPPPIRFTVKYAPDHFWKGDHFFGQSLAQLGTLCPKHDYKLIGLHYNNAFLVPKELKQFKEISIEKAYASGYRDRPERKAKFSWDRDMEELQSLTPTEGIKFLKEKFSKYKGKFTCSIAKA